ncbi:pheromone alpha factor receptor [Sporothrix curviconia]|uniref:Pheromone alpha factor receptor n=1 Tax=Sporothrix curviconia TaxID=1260050 RepID=A0ABP0B9F5_9PEZI
MASSPASAPFDPRNQTFFLEGSHNMSIPVWVPNVDAVFHQAVSTAINYSTQIGACFIMLLVTLTMTPKSRFSRASTVINIAGLVIGTIRCTLLALYFTSSYLEFYTFFSGDFSLVKATDTQISAVATFLSLPQIILIEAALSLQAYSMIQLWPSAWRAVVVALSVLIAAGAMGFKCASVILRMRSSLDFYIGWSALWVYEADLAFTATTIFWFCFIFIIRLVLHMWEYRSVLPPMGGVSAMEVLVMANGILMLVPVVFAAMELGGFTTFEAGSLTYTSVIVLLPLGSLIAQSVTRSDSYIMHSGNSGGSAASGSRNTRNGSGSAGAAGVGGAYRRAATSNTVTGKKSNNDFGTWSHASDGTTVAMVQGTVSTHVNIQSGSSHSQGGSNMGMDRTRNISLAVDPIEKQLQDIDATPLSPHEGCVWVDREVEVRRDMV